MTAGTLAMGLYCGAYCVRGMEDSDVVGPWHARG